jgi:diguanylate cyclase (GGDEF)-like protein
MSLSQWLMVVTNVMLGIVIGLVCSLTTWRRDRVETAYLRISAYAIAWLCLTWVLLGLRGFVSIWIYSVLANATLGIAMTEYLRATASFVGRPFRLRFSFLAALAYAGISVVWGIIWPDLAQRTSLVSLGAAVELSTSCALLLQARRHLGVGGYLTMLTFAALAILQWMRGAITFFDLPKAQTMLNIGATQMMFTALSTVGFATLGFGFLLIFNERMNDKLRFLANHDGLTGALNRTGIYSQLNRECAAHNTRNFGVLMLDADRFKQINDQFGHPTGDLVLQKIVEVCRASLATNTAKIGRLGGEEFLLMISSAPAEQIFALAESLRVRIEQMTVHSDQGDVSLTVSIGCAVRLNDTPTQLLGRADKALYAAKSQGRNCVVVAPA